MKIKNLFILSIAAVVGLTACSKSDGTDNSASTSVTIKIGAPQTASLDNTSVQGGNMSTITDVNLFFLNSSGIKVGSYYITTTSTPISVADLEVGCTFPAVNSGATSVYVVANYGSDISSTSNITLIKAKTLPLTSGGTNVQNGVDKWKTVLMSNDAATVDNGAIIGTPRVASVKLSPVVSRIEIAKVEGINGIDAFNLDGIFINNNFSSVSVGVGGYTPLYYNALQETSFNATNFGGLSDIAANMDKAPAGKCYGYQIAPIAADGGQGTYPHIILKLSNIIIGMTGMPTGYVTVKKYTGAEGGFKANNVYKISSIKFSPENIRPNPEEDDTDVTVTVSVLPWSVVNITPDLN